MTSKSISDIAYGIFGNPSSFAGPQGFQGNRGFQGNQGSQGNQGRQGSQGSQGAQGNRGFQGAQGAQGAQGSMLTPVIVNTLADYTWADTTNNPITSVDIPLGFSTAIGNSILFIAPCDHGGGVAGASGGGATWAVSQSRSGTTTGAGNIPTVAIGWGRVLLTSVNKITLSLNATFGVRAGKITVYEIDTKGAVLNIVTHNPVFSATNTRTPAPTAITPTATEQIVVIATMVNGNSGSEDPLVGDSIAYTPSSTGWTAQKQSVAVNNVNGSVVGESGVLINGAIGTPLNQSVTIAVGVGARDTICDSALIA